MTDAVEIVRDSILLTEEGAQLVQVAEESTVASESTLINTVELQLQDTITAEVVSVEIISEGVQGPPGISEDEMTYSKRFDFVGDTIVYRGEARVGASESASVWRIRRITFQIDGDVIEEWANGSAGFSNAWTARAGLAFS